MSLKLAYVTRGTPYVAVGGRVRLRFFLALAFFPPLCPCRTLTPRHSTHGDPPSAVAWGSPCGYSTGPLPLGLEQGVPNCWSRCPLACPLGPEQGRPLTLSR